MTHAIREHVTIEREGVIEIHHPGLAVGTHAEIIVLVEQSTAEEPPLVSFLGKGKGCFADAGEIDAFIQAERENWER